MGFFGGDLLCFLFPIKTHKRLKMCVLISFLERYSSRLCFRFLFSPFSSSPSCILENLGHWWLVANKSQQRKRNESLSSFDKLSDFTNSNSLVNLGHLLKYFELCCDELWVDWHFNFHIVIIIFFEQINISVCWLNYEVPDCLSKLPKSKNDGGGDGRLATRDFKR